MLRSLVRSSPRQAEVLCNCSRPSTTAYLGISLSRQFSNYSAVSLPNTTKTQTTSFDIQPARFTFRSHVPTKYNSTERKLSTRPSPLENEPKNIPSEPTSNHRVYIYDPDADEDEEETEASRGDPANIYRPEGEPMELPDDIDDYGPDRFPPLSEEDEPEKLSETGVYIYNPDEDEDEEETEVPAGDPASIYRPEGEPMELPDDPDDYGPDRFPTSREEDESEHVPSEPTSNNGDEIYNPYADEDDEELEVPEGDPAFIYRPEGEPMELPDDPDDYGPDRFPPLPEEDEEVETPASDAENSSSTEEDTRGSFSNQRDRSLSHDDINDANYADDRGPRNSKGS